MYTHMVFLRFLRFLRRREISNLLIPRSFRKYGEYQRTLTGLKRVVFTGLSHYVRQWDFQAAQRPDIMIANSQYLGDRIRKYYRRDSIVIYPPVDTSQGYLAQITDDYYLTVGRVTSLKRTELIVQACTDLDRRLIVVGTGEELERLKAMAGSTVSFLGYVDEEKLRGLYARCRAFLFAAKEDFGIAPVEAQSYGRPVIAFGQGGALESVKGWTPEGMAPVASCTGLFFEHQTVASLSEAIRKFESVEDQFDPAYIRSHSLRFDTSVFRSAIRNIVDSGAASHHELFVESNFIAQPETMHA
jgi:glycosyltransferase involved in cell wall biosynthesis